MLDFLMFRSMLTPKLIEIIFVIGLILCVCVGVADFFGPAGYLKGLQVIIIGPIALRVICEILILFFRINDTLSEIKNQLTITKES